MYIFNNIHDRDYKSEYPEETKVIFDISEKQIGNAKNSDWSSLTSGDIACVVTSSRKISTFFKVTEIKGLGDSHPTDGETFILRGEVVAKLPKEDDMQKILTKFKVQHKYLPKNQFSIGFNVANLGRLLDGLGVKTREGLQLLSTLDNTPEPSDAKVL